MLKYTECWHRERKELRRKCLQMAQLGKEVVIDRFNAGAMIVKTFDVLELNELLRFAHQEHSWHEFENCGRMAAVLEKEELAREALLNKMGQFMFSKLLPLHICVNFVFCTDLFLIQIAAGGAVANKSTDAATSCGTDAEASTRK